MGLREFREERGLSLVALSALTGVDPSTVSKIERGLVEPRPATIMKLARGLRLSPQRLRELIVQDAIKIGGSVQ